MSDDFIQCLECSEKVKRDDFENWGVLVCDNGHFLPAQIAAPPYPPLGDPGTDVEDASVSVGDVVSSVDFEFDMGDSLTDFEIDMGDSLTDMEFDLGDNGEPVRHEQAHVSEEQFGEFLHSLSRQYALRNGGDLTPSHLSSVESMSQSLIESHSKHYTLDEHDASQFLLNLSEKWNPAVIYFRGDILHRQFLKNAQLTIVAVKTHVNVHPVLVESNSDKQSCWGIVFRTDEQMFFHQLGDNPEAMSATIQPDDEYMVCIDCSVEHPVKLLVDEFRNPEQGVCNQCHSTRFIASIKSFESPTNIEVIFDRSVARFLQSYDVNSESIDLKSLWDEYVHKGDFSLEDAISDKNSQLPKSLDEILLLELKLHRSSAELYAALRSIPLSNPNYSEVSTRALTKLRSMNRELLELSSQILHL